MVQAIVWIPFNEKPLLEDNDPSPYRRCCHSEYGGQSCQNNRRPVDHIKFQNTPIPCEYP